jgi:hypothetical protein
LWIFCGKVQASLHAEKKASFPTEQAAAFDPGDIFC